MNAAEGPPVSAESRRPGLSLPGQAMPGSLARNYGRHSELLDTGRNPRHCVVAAGVAVAVVLCLCWARTSRIPPGFAMLNSHAIQTTTQIESGGGGSEACTTGSPQARWYLRGMVSLRPGHSGTRQNLVGIFLAAYVRSRVPPADSPDSAQLAARAPGIPGPGWHVRSPLSGTCHSAGRQLQVTHQTASSWRAYGHRRGISVLAFNRWAALGASRSKADNCSAGEVAGLAQRLDVAFPDFQKGGIGRILRINPGSQDGTRADQLEEAVSGDPPLICVMIRGNRQDVVSNSPERWCGAYGGTGGPIGSSDRASLPGRSTRYRVIWLVCPRCGSRMACLFYDEGDMPLCANPPHGRMEVQR